MRPGEEVEKRPDIFREVRNDLDVNEEFTAYTGSTTVVLVVGSAARNHWQMRKSNQHCCDTQRDA
jgi:hypothetical protein